MILQQIELQSPSTLCSALALLEVSQLVILRYGEEARVLHSLQHQWAQTNVQRYHLKTLTTPTTFNNFYPTQDSESVHLQSNEDLCGYHLELIQPNVHEKQEQRGKKHGSIVAIGRRV